MIEIIELINDIKGDNYNAIKDIDKLNLLYDIALECANNKNDFIENSSNYIIKIKNGTIQAPQVKKWVDYVSNIVASYYAVKIYQNEIKLDINDYNKVLEFFSGEELSLEIKSLGIYGLAQITKEFDNILSGEMIKCAYSINHNLHHITRKRLSNTKIKVAFIVQEYGIWDHQRPIYEKMRDNNLFEVYMFVCPEVDFKKKCCGIDYHDNNYFLNNYPEAIKIYDDQGRIIDFGRLEIDYYFYSRPYDHYLPYELRSYCVSHYSKCCYVPYCYPGPEFLYNIAMSETFFDYAYMVFEDKLMCDSFNTKYSFQVHNKLKFFENLGYPSLEQFMNKNKTGNIRKKILWTPRWNYDPIIGGSNFLEYKDEFIKLAIKYSECDFVFRPHPLMFDELLNKKLFLEEEKKDYLNLLNKSGIKYDVDTPTCDAILNTDILITDISSVITMYFMTGKPIIYCDKDMHMIGKYKKMKELLYIANNWDDVVVHLDNIMGQNDVKKEMRFKFINKEFSDNINSTEKIVDRIIVDFNNEYELLYI